MTLFSKEDENNFFDAVQNAIDFGGDIGPTCKGDALNIGCDHVAVLLEDALACFRRGSFGTAVFLAITAIEETAKADLFLYRKELQGKKLRGDPLYSHKAKHKITIRPTTFMGRLQEAIGPERCQSLVNDVVVGNLITERERALYVHAGKEGVTAPSDVVSRERAREILLLAIEAADDVLVGYTEHSYEVGERFSAWFDMILSEG